MASLVLYVFGGSVVFPCLFSCLRRVLTHSPFIKNKKNVAATAVTIAMRSTSIIQALWAIIAGVNIVKATHQDVIFSRSVIVEVYASFGVPYMIYDIGAMYIVHREVKNMNDVPTRKTVFSFVAKEWILVTHHLAIAIVFYPTVMFLRNGKGDFFIGCFFLTELSTPALNLRTILIKLNLGHTAFFRFNNAAILITFFVCRILLFPFMYWAYSHNKRLSFYDTLTSMRAPCHIGCAVMLAMQVFWFVMFVRALMRPRRDRDLDASPKRNTVVADGNHVIPPLRSVGKAD